MLLFDRFNRAGSHVRSIAALQPGRQLLAVVWSLVGRARGPHLRPAAAADADADADADAAADAATATTTTADATAVCLSCPVCVCVPYVRNIRKK